MLAHAPEQEARLLARAANAAPDEELVFHVSVQHDDFDFAAFRGADAEQRDLLVADRKAGSAVAVQRARAELERLGASIESETWLVSGMIVRARAALVPEIVANPHVLAASPSDKMIPNTWDGRKSTDEMRSQSLYQHGYHGQHGSRELKIGILEAENAVATNYLHCSHDGWDDWASGPTRLSTAKRCTSSSCMSSNACTTSGSTTHGTWVAHVAAGSIEQGQDSSYPGTQTTAQRQRSGHAEEAEVHFWVANGGSSCGLLKGLEDAVSLGVDVLNMSWAGPDVTTCSTSYDSCNFNTALLNAFNAGVFLVASSNNVAPPPGGCNVGWPARRSTVMAVGGLDTRSSNTPISSTFRVDPSLRSDNLAYSWGTHCFNVYGGAQKCKPMIDLIAPYDVTGAFVGTSGYSFGASTGTSFSAPAVAALATLTRHWMLDLGWADADNPRREFPHVLLYGDRYSGSLTSPSSEFGFSVSSSVGFGRAIARSANHPDVDNRWKSFNSTISNSGTHYWSVDGNPQSTTIEGVKVAVAWFDSDFVDVADLQVSIVDWCPGGSEVVLKNASNGQTMRKAIQLTTPSEIHGRCLWVKVVGTSVPPGGEQYFGGVYSYDNNVLAH